MNYHAFKTEKKGPGSINRTTLEEHLRFSTRAALLAKDTDLPSIKPTGSSIQQYLFRPLTGSMMVELRSVITNLIRVREPRVDVMDVELSSDPGMPGRIGLQVDYRVKETMKVDRCHVTI